MRDWKTIEGYVRHLSTEGYEELEQVWVESNAHREAHGEECAIYPLDPDEGRLMLVLVRSLRAKRVLEIGCGLGYSALWLARGLAPGGRVDTIENDPGHAALARKNLESTPGGRAVRLLEGDELAITRGLRGKYDFVFHDSGWERFDELYEPMLARLKIGGLLVVSSIFPTHLGTETDAIAGTYEVTQRLFSDKRLESAITQNAERLAVCVRIR